ncbi:hypothetical protein BN1058_02375 [Paraliobacillus sp. PM-2]|uniref:hypothetical protein n=1 Tax=Paraliobacillus sp. PM-2 TaxID=1462524 RepID=UPI00061BEC74|nr:hypothetical protein [Paraliobacillus sp. PM-2]CQR48033.1 hypothetical protein BN1058_02375 [Paraliobacillus sp. PM-2]
MENKEKFKIITENKEIIKIILLFIIAASMVFFSLQIKDLIQVLEEIATNLSYLYLTIS